MRARLSLRRFPDTITRIRTSGRRVNGLWVDDEPVETEHRCSVQPVELESLVEREGDRVVERVKVFLPGADALRAANDTGPADEVRWFNRRYVVETSVDWGVTTKLRHTKAVLLRSY